MLNIVAWSPDAIWVIAQKVWWFLVVLGVLISFHELGHFLAARWVGVTVLKFSLGFGPKLFGRQVGDTEYVVSAVPLGGYVKLFGEEEGEALSPEDQRRSFTHKPLLSKMFIVAAGPGFNFLLAYLIFAGWLSTGAPLPMPSLRLLTAEVEALLPDSPADRAGLRVGDRVVSINDQEISTRPELVETIATSKGKSLTIEVRRNGQVKTFVVMPVPSPVTGEDPDDTFYTIGIEEPPPVVRAVMHGLPAAAAGFQPGDRVVAIEGKEIQSWSEMTVVVKTHPGRPLRFEVLRDGSRVVLTVTPAEEEREVNGQIIKEGRIGISGRQTFVWATSPAMALIQGMQATWRWSELTMVALYKLITGDISRKHLGGPLMIANISGSAAEQGVSSVLFLIAILSINLGILNLLPIPILDGGHLLFFGIEAIMRKPLGERQREVAQQVGLALLVCIMVFAFWNDIERLLSR